MHLPGLPYNHDGSLQHFALPGGYTLVYLNENGGTLCPHCADRPEARQYDEPDWNVVGAFTHDEGPPINCDHCGLPMHSSYGDPDAEPAQLRHP